MSIINGDKLHMDAYNTNETFKIGKYETEKLYLWKRS